MKGNHLNYVKKKRLSRNLSSPEWNSPQQPGSCKRTRCRAAQYLTFPSQKWRVVLRKFSSLPDSWSDKSSGVSLQEAVLNVGEQPLSSIFQLTQIIWSATNSEHSAVCPAYINATFSCQAGHLTAEDFKWERATLNMWSELTWIIMWGLRNTLHYLWHSVCGSCFPFMAKKAAEMLKCGDLICQLLRNVSASRLFEARPCSQ